MRVATPIALILMAQMGFTTAAAAEDVDPAKAAQCDALGGVVDQLVTLRQEGKRENRAIRMLSGDKSDVEESLRPAVQFLSGWVYSLSDAELTFEPGAKYAETCKTQ